MKLEIGQDEYAIPDGMKVVRVWLRGRQPHRDVMLRNITPEALLDMRRKWPHMRGTPAEYAVMGKEDYQLLLMSRYHDDEIPESPGDMILLFPIPNAENEMEGEFEFVAKGVVELPNPIGIGKVVSLDEPDPPHTVEHGKLKPVAERPVKAKG